MRALGLALIATLAIGCSATPTSPTSSLQPVTTVVSQDAKPDHTPGTLKVTIYFYIPELPYGGGVHMVDVPVAVWYDPAHVVTLSTGKQGSVSIDVPKTGVDKVYYRIDPRPFEIEGWSGCIYAPESFIPLPYTMRENWVHVLTGCTL